MNKSSDDISLQEPLVQLTWPLRDDAGWQMLEASQQDESAQGESANNSHAGSGVTTPLLQSTNSQALALPGPAVEELSAQEASGLDGDFANTLRRTAMSYEEQARALRIALLEAMGAEDAVKVPQLRFQIAALDYAASEAHRKAAVVIYAANNEGLRADVIDLQGLRTEEVGVVETLLQAKPPSFPMLRFMFDPLETGQRATVDAIARHLCLPFYHDQADTVVILQDRKSYMQDRLVAKLRHEATNRLLL